MLQSGGFRSQDETTINTDWRLLKHILGERYMQFRMTSSQAASVKEGGIYGKTFPQQVPRSRVRLGAVLERGGGLSLPPSMYEKDMQERTYLRESPGLSSLNVQ